MPGKRSVARRSRPSLPGSPGGVPDSGSSRGPEIPRTNTDPIWSLCPWPLELIIGNQTIEIPAMPAVDWLKYLMGGPDLQQLVTDIVPEAEDYFLDGDLPIELLYKFALEEIIGKISARSWWITLRLISTATSNWHIIGPKLLMEGIDASKISLAAWLDVVLFIAVTHMEPDKATMFGLQLEVPPPANVLNGVFGTSESKMLDTMTVDRKTFLAMA